MPHGRRSRFNHQNAPAWQNLLLLQDSVTSFGIEGRALLRCLRRSKGTQTTGLYGLHADEGMVLPVPRRGRPDFSSPYNPHESPDKIFELAERGGCNLNLEGRQAIQHGIDIGRGGIWLELTEEQYAKLKKH